MRFTIVLHALNRYITPMPMRIIMAGVTRLNLADSSIMAAGMRENTNALTTVAYSPLRPGSMHMPITMDRDAPRPAPEDMPVVYGSARGFLRMYCIAHPATASPAPTDTAVIARGRRDSHTMYRSMRSTGAPVR